ncbi:MAG: hypothetical protein ACAF48_00205 [Candidatus Carsonella ruddii]
MYQIFLISGGKDSNFMCSFLKYYNLFIKINNCNNYIDKKYSILNLKNFKKKLFLINLNFEYKKILNLYIFKNINIDFYCNKLIKIYLIKKIYKKKIIFSGHYFKKIKKFFFSSIDQKKDQIFFLNFNNNMYSFLGYYNKLYIKFISFKNNFFCKNKKSTTGICFNFINKKKIYFLILENNMILNIINTINYFNLGKKIHIFKIIKIKNNNIYIIKKKNLFFKIIEINFLSNIKNMYFKIKSQNIKFLGKFINYKNKKFFIFYKKKKNLQKNILLMYNDLAIFNSKIIKKN